MIVARTIDDARAAVQRLPRPLGLVPTMGALHGGHLSLVQAARERCASAAASIFVNPTQFGPDEEWAAYPRGEAHDLELLQADGIDLAFVPTVEEMYPAGFATTVHVGGEPAVAFEGAGRPGHFDGVATVVAKLLVIIRPDVAFFGEKDAQQLAVVRRMISDLDLPVRVESLATAREPDGLALSSRNQRLTAAERTVAPRLYRALCAGREAARAGERTTEDVVAAVRAVLAGDGSAEGPGFMVDYVAVVDPDSFAPLAAPRPGGLIVAAARLGSVRLVDNLFLDGGDSCPAVELCNDFDPAAREG